MRTDATTKPPGLLRRSGRVTWWTVRAFFADSVPRLGAALAFYGTVAVAPLLVLTIAVAGIVFQEGEARTRILGEIERLAGSQAVEVLARIEAPDERSGNFVATVIGLATLVIGGFSVFLHLQDALNVIWRARPENAGGWRRRLKRRLFSFGLVVATGFILLVSLVVSAGLNLLTQSHVFQSGLWQKLSGVINLTLSVAVTTYLFAMIFKVLPDRPVGWRDTWIGAFVTALLFTLGKSALALYLSRTSTAAAYGVAGSAITLLLWNYYASQIVLFGAEFTRVQATTSGGRKPMDSEPPEPADGEKTPTEALPARGDFHRTVHRPPGREHAGRQENPVKTPAQNSRK
jgi:membrane protein